MKLSLNYNEKSLIENSINEKINVLEKSIILDNKKEIAELKAIIKKIWN